MNSCTTQAATTTSKRFGHAALELRGRNAKARKIEATLALTPSRRLRVLEVGTGSGGIAHYFGTHPTLECGVQEVDVKDSRQIREGYHFMPVDDVQLPFQDGSVDIVISNHAPKHVGDEKPQQIHFGEHRRVLRDDAGGSLAAPNRWQVVVPHYRLVGLSWLPPSWRTPYVRFRNRCVFYDCALLTVPQLEPLLHAAGFAYVQAHARALWLTYEIERFVYRTLLKRIPDRVYASLRKVFPTLIFLTRVPRPRSETETSFTPESRA